MTETEHATDDLSRTRSRTISGTVAALKWRDKIKEKVANKVKGLPHPSEEEQQDNVSDFLGRPSTGNAAVKPPNLGLKIPEKSDKLDPTTYAPAPTYHRKQPRKNKGLTVSFRETAPEIIGIGGDECEIPTQHVLGSWTEEMAHHESDAQKSTDLPPTLSPGTSGPAGISSPDFLAPTTYVDRRSSIQRVPTGRSASGGWEQKRLSMNLEEGLVQAHSAENENPANKNMPYSSGHAVAPMARNADTHQTTPMSKAPLRPSQDSHSSPSVFKPFSLAGSTPTTPSSAGSTQRQHSHLQQEMHMSSVPASSIPQKTLPIRADGRDRAFSNESTDSQATLPGDIESAEFYSRVQHLRGVFRLAAEKAVDVENKALEHWLRMASWWFVRGKTTLEKNIERPPSRSNPAGGRFDLRNLQCYVDLAKAWWAVEDMIPDLIDEHNIITQQRNKSRQITSFQNDQILAVAKRLKAQLNDFAIFMNRDDLLPPPALLIQGADPCIWLSYPAIPSGILSLTAFLDPRILTTRMKRAFFPVIFSDDSEHFFHGSIFANATILTNRNEVEYTDLPCLISMFRSKKGSDFELGIAGQDGQISLHLQNDPLQGPTWQDVRWSKEKNVLHIRLSEQFSLSLAFWDDDYRLLTGLTRQSQSTKDEWQIEDGEQLVFDDILPIFHYDPAGVKASSFPAGPIKQASVRLMRRSLSSLAASTKRTTFDGFRLIVRTPPSSRIMGVLDQTFARGEPVLYTNLRGEHEAPALLLALRNGAEKTSMILTFSSLQQRSYFFTQISATVTSQDDVVSKEIPLQDMTPVELFHQPGAATVIQSLSLANHWKSLKVITEPPSDGLEYLMFSNRSRICSVSDLGTAVDFANLATGELQIALDAVDTKSIKLFRPAQNNLVVSFSDGLFPKNEHPRLQTTLHTIAQVPSARVYRFPTLDALHLFQRLVTGHEVVYDGLATSYSISHRRNMIPLYKKQEATQTRIQVLVHTNRGQKTYQLIAAFVDFPHGKIMSFQLRSADVFEATKHSGKHCIRLQDAKFALPKPPESAEMAWDMVCLDTPEYPAEHDDIVIGFDTEQDRDAFAAALPAALKVSRLASFKR